MRVVISDLAESMTPDQDTELAVLAAGLPEAQVIVQAADDAAALRESLAEADALITGYLKVPAELMDAAPRLRCISVMATGFDNVDLEAAKDRGIAVMCIGEYCTREVAEHTMAFLYALNRNLKQFGASIDSGRWEYFAAPPRPRLATQTLGIVGLGRIGSAVARLARGAGMQVVATDPYVDPAHGPQVGARMVDRAELFAVSDVVSNHMNGTPENVGYFDAAAFAAMVRRPAFVNTARGSAVVEADLAAALDSGQVRAAALDVLALEPPDLVGSPLAGRPDVLLTPHSAFCSPDSWEALAAIPAQNVVAYLTGRHDEVFKRVV